MFCRTPDQLCNDMSHLYSSRTLIRWNKSYIEQGVYVKIFGRPGQITRYFWLFVIQTWWIVFSFVDLMVWTFVCTKLLAIIKDKSNIESFISIVENKFRLPPWSLLIIIMMKDREIKHTSVPIRKSHTYTCSYSLLWRKNNLFIYLNYNMNVLLLWPFWDQQMCEK